MDNMMGASGGFGPSGNAGADIKEERTYIQEIRGTLFLVNEALANAQSHYRFEGLKRKPSDTRPFKRFYLYLSKLTLDSRELLEENDPELLEYLDKWLNGMDYVMTSQEKTPEEFWKWFEIGEKLAINLQKTLYRLGIKDSNVSQRVGFPFALVSRLVELQRAEKEAEREARKQAREEVNAI